jgi:hypothetical protein
VDPFRQAELTDALARRRLAPAEIATIPPGKVVVLFETAARRLYAAPDEMAARTSRAVTEVICCSRKNKCNLGMSNLCGFPDRG